MSDHSHFHDNKKDGVTRRHALECMVWAGTGVLWGIRAGVPVSLGLLGEASAAKAASTGFTSADVSTRSPIVIASDGVPLKPAHDPSASAGERITSPRCKVMSRRGML